jgi:hypothetical protein
MRTRAWWLAGRTGLGSGTSMRMSSRIRGGLLDLSAVGIQAWGACLLLLPESLVRAPRRAGQHRYRRPRHAVPRARGAVLGGALRYAARALS